jgi:RHH-type transcriptional regulator, rel operon repressor / antitoxin RelB
MQEVMTIRVEREVKERLERLAKATARSRSFLAAEAIRQYLDLHAWQVEQILEGIEEAEAGKLVAHEDVVTKWEAKRAGSVDRKSPA